MRVPAAAKITVNATAKTWAFDKMSGEGAPHGDASALSSLIGQEAPDFEVGLLGGETFRLSDHLGKRVVVLDFWATWCGPCIQAMPEVIAAVESVDPTEVTFIAVNQQEAPDKVATFLGRKGWEKLVVALDDGAVREKYEVSGIPTTVIISKTGKVTMVHSGYHEGLEEDLKLDLQDALSAE